MMLSICIGTRQTDCRFGKEGGGTMGRVIVIEDNLVFADYVCRLLKSKGFQSVSTSTCNGARKLFAKMQEDDIVLADMRLPDGDGIALLEELRWKNCGSKAGTILTSL